MPQGVYDRTKAKPNKGWFKKGRIPLNKLHPELCKPNSGSFKKGHKSWNKNKKLHYPVWNKGKKCPQFSGKNNPNWKNGRIKVWDYIFIYKPEHPFCRNEKYVFEHRLVIEKLINRYLLPTESCHHLNGIKDDNQPINLMAFTSESAHQRFHHNPDNVKKSEIIFDGRKLSKHSS